MNQTNKLRKPASYQKKQKQGFLYNSRGMLLYILPIALIPAAIFSFVYGNLSGIIINTGACVLFFIAARFLRNGIAAEALYQNKKITQAPKWPSKTIAALMVGAATSWVALMGAGHSIIVAIIFGFVAVTGMFFLYGFDPRREKMVTGSHGYTAAEISQTIDEAESQINGIKLANKQIINRDFNQRILMICRHAEEILAMLEESPGDIRRARKFLNVYLDGALKVTEGYADMQKKHQSDELSENFNNVLKTIETVFLEQKQKLLEDDILDLDVKIEVLTAQLKNEGVI